jgi:molybdopterin synthase sulfur carrier subunit
LKVKVKFLGPISQEDKIIEIKDYNELKEILKKEIDKEWLDSVTVAVNDKIVNSLEDIKDGDVITLLPPVCGG